MGCLEGMFHSHFSHSLPMAARSKIVKSTIRIGSDDEQFGVATQQGLQ